MTTATIDRTVPHPSTLPAPDQPLTCEIVVYPNDDHPDLDGETCGQPAVATCHALCTHGHPTSVRVCASCADDAEHGGLFCVDCWDDPSTPCTGCTLLAVIHPLPGRG